jgi:hypothetical protein
MADMAHVVKSPSTHRLPGPQLVGAAQEGTHEDGDLSDMLGELRVVLPTAQLLTAFLITVPFMPAFSGIVEVERYVFLATFILSVSGLVLLSAPAVQHRMMRPLVDRITFKRRASKQILLGCAAISMALILAAQFVLSVAMDSAVLGTVGASGVAALLGLFWWLLPGAWKG